MKIIALVALVVKIRVIDFGCALAISLNYLQGKDAGNGIEINPDAAKVAELYCEQVIVAD